MQEEKENKHTLNTGKEDSRITAKEDQHTLFSLSSTMKMARRRPNHSLFTAELVAKKKWHKEDQNTLSQTNNSVKKTRSLSRAPSPDGR